MQGSKKEEIKIKKEMRLLQTGLGRLDLKKVGSCVRLRERHFQVSSLTPLFLSNFTTPTSKNLICQTGC